MPDFVDDPLLVMLIVSAFLLTAMIAMPLVEEIIVWAYRRWKSRRSVRRDGEQ